MEESKNLNITPEVIENSGIITTYNKADKISLGNGLVFSSDGTLGINYGTGVNIDSSGRISIDKGAVKSYNEKVVWKTVLVPSTYTYTFDVTSSNIPQESQGDYSLSRNTDDYTVYIGGIKLSSGYYSNGVLDGNDYTINVTKDSSGNENLVVVLNTNLVPDSSTVSYILEVDCFSTNVTVTDMDYLAKYSENSTKGGLDSEYWASYPTATGITTGFDSVLSSEFLYGKNIAGTNNSGLYVSDKKFSVDPVLVTITTNTNNVITASCTINNFSTAYGRACASGFASGDVIYCYFSSYIENNTSTTITFTLNDSDSTTNSISKSISGGIEYTVYEQDVVKLKYDGTNFAVDDIIRDARLSSVVDGLGDVLVCSTATATATKEIVKDGYLPSENDVLYVRFSNGSSSATRLTIGGNTYTLSMSITIANNDIIKLKYIANNSTYIWNADHIYKNVIRDYVSCSSDNEARLKEISYSGTVSKYDALYVLFVNGCYTKTFFENKKYYLPLLSTGTVTECTEITVSNVSTKTYVLSATVPNTTSSNYKNYLIDINGVILDSSDFSVASNNITINSSFTLTANDKIHVKYISSVYELYNFEGKSIEVNDTAKIVYDGTNWILEDVIKNRGVNNEGSSKYWANYSKKCSTISKDYRDECSTLKNQSSAVVATAETYANAAKGYVAATSVPQLSNGEYTVGVVKPDGETIKVSTSGELSLNVAEKNAKTTWATKTNGISNHYVFDSYDFPTTNPNDYLCTLGAVILQNDEFSLASDNSITLSLYSSSTATIEAGKTVTVSYYPKVKYDKIYVTVKPTYTFKLNDSSSFVVKSTTSSDYAVTIGGNIIDTSKYTITTSRTITITDETLLESIENYAPLSITYTQEYDEITSTGASSYAITKSGSAFAYDSNGIYTVYVTTNGTATVHQNATVNSSGVSFTSNVPASGSKIVVRFALKYDTIITAMNNEYNIKLNNVQQTALNTTSSNYVVEINYVPVSSSKYNISSTKITIPDTDNLCMNDYIQVTYKGTVQEYDDITTTVGTNTYNITSSSSAVNITDMTSSNYAVTYNGYNLDSDSYTITNVSNVGKITLSPVKAPESGLDLKLYYFGSKLSGTSNINHIKTENIITNNTCTIDLKNINFYNVYKLVLSSTNCGGNNGSYTITKNMSGLKSNNLYFNTVFFVDNSANYTGLTFTIFGSTFTINNGMNAFTLSTIDSGNTWITM